MQVEVFQITKDRLNDKSDWPDWLHDAWNKDNNRIGSFFQIVSLLPSFQTKFFLNTRPDGQVVVNDGDFIIKEFDRDIYLIRKGIFLEMQRHVSEWSIR